MPHVSNIIHPIQELTAAEFEKSAAQDKTAVLVDVRSPGEYHSGHIPGAIHINLMDVSFKQKISQLTPEKAYFVYCRSGARSRQACLLMSTMGFSQVHNLTGGILTWKGAIAQSE